MRRILAVLITARSVVLLPTAAQAAVRFHSGPTATDIGTQLRVTGNVSGLGEADLTATVDAIGIVGRVHGFSRRRRPRSGHRG
jgi:hypothetical protein